MLDNKDLTVLLLPVGTQLRAEQEDTEGRRRGRNMPAMRLRYLFADWPVPTVYDAESFLGVNGELPLPPFVRDVLPPEVRAHYV